MSFSFGTPSSAPAAGGLSGGFSFGANKPATPGFGLTATSQPSTGLFGSTATSSAPAFGSATPAFGATSGFGAAATPAFGAAATPSFGSTSTAPAFGTGTTPGFGAASQAPAFGSTTTPAFGSTPAFGATSAPAFGTTTAAPAFGATSAAPTFGATSTAPAFGTANPGFGATSAAPAFGATTNPAFGQTATPGFGLGTGGLNFGAGSNTSTANTGLTLGAPATSSTGLGGLGGFGLGTSTQTTGLGGGLFASTTSTGSTGLYDMFPHGSPMIPITQTFQMLPHTPMQHPMNPGNSGVQAYELRSPKRECYKTITPSSGAKLGTTSVTGTQPSASAAPSLGLGGVAPVGTANTTTSGDGKTEPPKQIKLPNEISSTVDSFKDFIKKQKTLSSEIMRVSIKPLHKVAREAEATLRLALSLQGEVGRARAHSRRLRASAAAALATAETLSSYPPTDLEGNAPPAYVKELISELEQQLITFRRQMDIADKHMQASPKLLTEQELTLGIRRMHESLVALAGRLQAVHAQVEDQKEQYLNLRKYVLKDPTNVFDTPDPSSTLDQILRDAEGTRKKTKTNVNVSNYGSAVLSDPRAVLGNIQQLAGPTPFTYISTTLSPFPNQDTSGGSWQPPAAAPATSFGSSFASYSAAPADSFQLQKPPGKRGKQ